MSDRSHQYPVFASLYISEHSVFTREIDDPKKTVNFVINTFAKEMERTVLWQHLFDLILP